MESVGIGTIAAVLLSWNKNHDVVWAIIAGCFGWFYVVYYLFEYGWDFTK